MAREPNELPGCNPSAMRLLTANDVGTVNAVSYTHLDVYKRQLEDLAHALGQRAGGDVGQAAGREADQQAHGARGEIGLGMAQARQQRQRSKRAQGVATGERCV